MKKTEKENIEGRSKFIHGLLCNPRYTIFNWSFWLSAFITGVSMFVNRKNSVVNNTVLIFFKNHSFDLFEISIGAIGIILSAIAIVIVIFDKKQLQRIVTSNNKTFESFIFPYRYSATIWGVLCLISVVSPIINLKLGESFIVCLNYLWLFILIYAFLYPLYLISEIIEYIMYSSTINK